MNPDNLTESEANAQLIAEAGTVANETGFTPRQLADQNKELREVLEKALRFLLADGDNSGPVYRKGMELIEALKTPK